MKQESVFRSLGALFTAAVLTLSIAGCSGGGGDDDEFVGTARISGRALLPRSADPAAREADVTPVANTPFIVVDLNNLAGDPIASGTTDSDGVYDVEVPEAAAAAVIVQGPVRVSGLFNAVERRIEKDFDSATDIACEAGVKSVSDGSLRAVDVDRIRIRNLEDAAEIILNRRFVNFLNSEDVSLAAIQARVLTNDGAEEPREEDFDNVTQ